MSTANQLEADRARALEIAAEHGRALAMLRRAHDTLIKAVLRAGTLADARIAAERARLALQPMPAVPLETPPGFLHDPIGAVEGRGRLRGAL